MNDVSYSCRIACKRPLTSRVFIFQSFDSAFQPSIATWVVSSRGGGCSVVVGRLGGGGFPRSACKAERLTSTCSSLMARLSLSYVRHWPLICCGILQWQAQMHFVLRIELYSCLKRQLPLLTKNHFEELRKNSSGVEKGGMSFLETNLTLGCKIDALLQWR